MAFIEEGSGSAYLAAAVFFSGLLSLGGGTSVQLDLVQAHLVGGLLLLGGLLGVQRLVDVVQLGLERVLDVLAHVDVVVDEVAGLLRHGRNFGREAAARRGERRVRVGQYLHRRHDLLRGHSLGRVLLGLSYAIQQQRSDIRSGHSECQK